MFSVVAYAVIVGLAVKVHAAPTAPVAVLSSRATDQCGVGIGSCDPGYCCSQYGWCGVSTDHCGAGCQSAFGICTGAGPNPPSNPAPPSCAPKTCEWAGHCFNDACSSPDDCDGVLSCISGRCGTPQCPPSGGGNPPTTPPPAPSPGGSVITKCTVPGTAAWTFDDGPYIYNMGILDRLEAAGMKATFFLNGNNYACLFDPQSATAMKRMIAEGHQLGSHTWSHPDISTLSDGELRYQVRKLEDAFMKVLGKTPRYFRAPFGNINNGNINLLTQARYKVVHWDVDSEDANGVTLEQAKANIRTGLATGDRHIVLDHETSKTIAQQLVPWFIATYKDKFRWVTVAECLGDTATPYMIAQTLDATDTCTDDDRSGSL